MNTWFSPTLVAAGMAMVLGACTGSAPSMPVGEPLTIDQGRYSATFNAARQVLRDRGFILERVDARAGIITTQPKTTAGLATPWDREQQSLAQEAEDLLERQQRVVRVTFEPVRGATEAPTASAGPAFPPSLIDAAGPVAMRVQVTIERISVPGRKLETEAIGQTTYWYDPALGARGLQPSFDVAIRRDEDSERRLMGLIETAAEAPQ